MKSRNGIGPCDWMRATIVSLSAAFSVAGSNSVLTRLSYQPRAGASNEAGLLVSDELLTVFKYLHNIQMICPLIGKSFASECSTCSAAL